MRLTIAILLCRLAGFLIPKSVSGSSPTPEPISPLVIRSYYISYSFTHSWPHMNSQRQLHFGSTLFDLRGDIDSGEKIEIVRQAVIGTLVAKGVQSPMVSIVSFQKIGSRAERVEP